MLRRKALSYYTGSIPDYPQIKNKQKNDGSKRKSTSIS